MKKQVHIFLALCLLLTSSIAKAQTLTQTIRGQVFDEVSQSGLPGANIVVVGSDPLLGAVTDPDGHFSIPAVPVGRISLHVTFIGYKEAILSELTLTSGKELVVRIPLREEVTQMSEVVVKAKKQEGVVNNELAQVSAHSFDFEETARYAGSRNDPARMAQNFAGVSGANDSRNDIIIRGNAPTGVLWRLEGVDIPNPNHFGAMGTTGGPVSMLNNNLLATSDFMTSAFPAQYGNATAGVFDLEMRKGNAFTHEALFQVGFNGFELGAEGPLGKKSGGASYLLNYRYSTLALFKKVGITPGTGDAVPYYQDLSYKLVFPTKKLGTFSLFGLGGKSHIDLLGSAADTSKTDLYGNISQDIYNTAAMGVVGLNHTYYFNKDLYGKLTLSVTYAKSGNTVDSLSFTNRQPVPYYFNDFRQTQYALHYQLNDKLSARDFLRMGIQYQLLDFQLLDSALQYDTQKFRVVRNFNNQAYLAQEYVQWQHHFSDALVSSIGLHHQWFTLNNSMALEPRFSTSYEFSSRLKGHVGFGIHHQLQPLPTYFIMSYPDNAAPYQSNRDLNFVKSFHYVAGVDYRLAPHLQFRTEVYFQDLYQAAVEQNPSSFSMLNAGADFGIPDVDSLINKGRGRNVGLELTLEKYFSQHYYFLFTSSFFRSRYEGSDKVWRHTAFDGGYVLNLLAGKEFQLGSAQKVLAIDLKSTLAGGTYYTPIDLAKSRAEMRTVFQEEAAYSLKNSPYFRTDLKIGFRLNRKKVTQEFVLDIQNLFNTQNIFNRSYDPLQDKIVRNNQLGLFPIPQYRLIF